MGSKIHVQKSLACWYNGMTVHCSACSISISTSLQTAKLFENTSYFACEQCHTAKHIADKQQNLGFIILQGSIATQAINKFKGQSFVLRFVVEAMTQHPSQSQLLPAA